VVLVTGKVLMVWYVATKLDGGFVEIWRVGYADHKAWTSLAFDLSDLTFWTMLIAGPALLLSDIGADQLTVQRLMTTRDEKAARYSLIFNAIFKFPSIVITLGMGVALYVFYKHFPDLLELTEEEYDKIVPYFVVTQLPAGLSGLVIAAIFAAAMSSFDSGLNCIVTAFTVDWYERLYRPARSDREYLKLAKTLTFALGAAVTVLAILIYRTGVKSIIDKSNTYLGFFGGALLGIFLLGVFTRRAKPLPTVLGGIASVAVVMLINVFNQSSEGGFLIHPYLFCLISCAITMLIGYAGSLLGPQLPFEKVKDYTMAGRSR
jgi:Na+/proline symporter